MNSQIEQLAEQCWTHCDEPLFSVRSPYWEFDRQKFARLIVEECVHALQEMHLWQTTNNQNYPNPWHDAIDEGISAITQHFGLNT